MRVVVHRVVPAVEAGGRLVAPHGRPVLEHRVRARRVGPEADGLQREHLLEHVQLVVLAARDRLAARRAVVSQAKVGRIRRVVREGIVHARKIGGAHWHARERQVGVHKRLLEQGGARRVAQQRAKDFND